MANPFSMNCLTAAEQEAEGRMHGGGEAESWQTSGSPSRVCKCGSAWLALCGLRGALQKMAWGAVYRAVDAW